MEDSAAAIEPTVPRDRWRVLPNGLDFSRFGKQAHTRGSLRAAWGISDDVLAIGIACAISARKRVDHFIRLIARLCDAGVRVHGFIAGDAHHPEDRPIVDNLHRLANALRVSDHVTFLGYVEPAEPLYHAWDLCVSTSRYETFGMTVLEAMSCGCAVVAYPGGSVAEVIGDASVVVEDGNEEELTLECLRLARDSEVRRRIAERGRRHAEETYDLRRIVPILANEYRALAKKHVTPVTRTS
jgi:glycosyltransferase involved in cell wall biosynthesis